MRDIAAGPLLDDEPDRCVIDRRPLYRIDCVDAVRVGRDRYVPVAVTLFARTPTPPLRPGRAIVRTVHVNP